MSELELGETDRLLIELEKVNMPSQEEMTTAANKLSDQIKSVWDTTVWEATTFGTACDAQAPLTSETIEEAIKAIEEARQKDTYMILSICGVLGYKKLDKSIQEASANAPYVMPIPILVLPSVDTNCVTAIKFDKNVAPLSVLTFLSREFPTITPADVSCVMLALRRAGWNYHRQMHYGLGQSPFGNPIKPNPKPISDIKEGT